MITSILCYLFGERQTPDNGIMLSKKIEIKPAVPVNNDNRAARLDYEQHLKQNRKIKIN